MPGIVGKTQDLAVENEYTWADSSDGDIAFRLDAPPTPWLASAIWTDTYTIDALDAGLNYLVFRIPITGDITEWQVERTRGSAVHDFHGSGFHRIHRAETSYKFYGLPHVDHKTGDVFQVQKGTKTGEITEYLGHVGGAAFTAPDGTGNLAATVDTVDELVSAVDDLTVGSDVTAERTSIYLDAADVAQNTIHSGSFDEAIVAGYDLEFSFSSGGATGTPRAFVSMPSDEFLRLTAQAAAPTTAAQAQGYNIRQIDVTGINTNALDTCYIWRGATDSDFYYDVWRGGNFRLQVFKNIQGGPTGQAGAAGDDGSPGAAGAAGAAGTDGSTVRTGNAAPAASLGDSGDWYLRTSNGQWYEKVNTTWHGRFTPPALSDSDPEDVGTTAAAGTATDGSRSDHVHIGDGSGGGGAGTVETELPVSGDGSSGDPVTIENQAIGHTKIGSSVGGVDQAAGRILEADGAGDVRWADKGGGGGGADGVADSLEVDITGQTLTVTVGRTVGADLSDTATIPDPVSIASLPTQDSALHENDLLGIWDASDGQVEKVTLGVTRSFMQDDLDATEVDVDATGFGDNLATTDTDVQLVAQAVNDLALVALSDDDPEDVGAIQQMTATG